MPSIRLAGGGPVLRALLCEPDSQQGARQGEWLVSREARPSGVLLQRLAAAFRLRDVPPARNVVCAAISLMGPQLRVELADGREFRAVYPHDGCGFPLPQVLAAVRSAMAGSQVTVVRVRRLRSPGAVAAGCEPKWKDVFAAPTHQAGAGVLPSPPGAHARVGLCRYVRRDGFLVLVATGTTDGAHLAGLRPGRRQGQCPQHVRGAVLVQQLGPTPRPLLWVETSACGRVIDSFNFQDLGQVPAAEAIRIARLAHDPEPPPS